VQDILRELLRDMVEAEPYRSYMRMADARSAPP
jgi:LysR family nitrogen assimilation transcriptional regulator